MNTTFPDVLPAIESMLANAGLQHAAAEANAIIDAALRRSEPWEAGANALAMAAERATGVPLAYVIGRTTFMGVDLITGPGAVLPRAQTELLGWTALGILDTLPQGMTPRLIDMCCGAGNLVCGISAKKPKLRAWASDLTDGAVAIARANVERLGLLSRVRVGQGDLFMPFAAIDLEESIDVIVCNPPCISSGTLASDRADLLIHEPRAAFDGGPFGADIFERVVRDSLEFLKPGGTLLFEVGVGQDGMVSKLFARAGAYEPALTYTDREGRARVVAARKGLAR